MSTATEFPVVLTQKTSVEKLARSLTLRLVQFEIASQSSHYIKQKFDNRMLFQLDPELPKGAEGSRQPIFLVTLENRSNKDVLVDRVRYRISRVGEVKGGAPGPVQPLARYHHVLAWEEGVQEAPISPVFRVPSGGAASFELELSTNEDGIGLLWDMRVELIASGRQVHTEDFELVMSKGAETP